MNRLINPHYLDPHAPYSSRRAVDPLDFNDEPDEDAIAIRDAFRDGDLFDWIDDDRHERPDDEAGQHDEDDD